MKKTTKNFSLKSLFNPITIATAIILLLGLILVSLAGLFLGRDVALAGVLTPEVTLIPAPTFTPGNLLPTLMPTPTSTLIIFLPEGMIGVGGYVKVAGTEGAGLRMRSDPNLDGEINFTAMDAEVFLVIGGPVESDGYTWWHLEAPYDKNRTGWSAGDFLSPIEESNE